MAKIYGNTVCTSMRPQSSNTIALESMNGGIVCNGEEITLTVGKDITVGQEIKFKYKKSNGYKIIARGLSMEDVIQPSVATDGYAEDTFTVEEGYETCKFIGAYFVVIAPSGEGGSGLPTVTEADNNKILQVVNGAWELVEMSGGSALPSAEEGSF